MPTNPDSPDHAFARFMRAYQDMVFTTALRLLGNHAQAEDIAQEVFLKAYENFPRLQTSHAAGGWLKTVAMNLSLNHLSRYRRRWRLFSELRAVADDSESVEFEFGDLPALSNGVLEGIDAEQRQVVIEQALAQLPEQQRVPLVLCHFEELSYAQIAEQLHMSLASVKVNIHRARVKLAKLLLQHQSSLVKDLDDSHE